MYHSFPRNTAISISAQLGTELLDHDPSSASECEAWIVTSSAGWRHHCVTLTTMINSRMFLWSFFFKLTIRSLSIVLENDIDSTARWKYDFSTDRSERVKKVQKWLKKNNNDNQSDVWAGVQPARPLYTGIAEPPLSSDHSMVEQPPLDKQGSILSQNESFSITSWGIVKLYLKLIPFKPLEKRKTCEPKVSVCF